MCRLFLPSIALLAGLVTGCGSSGSGAHPVTLVLDFTPNAAHAGIYEASTKGLDRRHGVKLVIRQPTASSDPLKLLSVGRADMAVSDIHDLGLARQRGEDLVGIGALVQRPLASVIAGPAVSRPRQLAGRRVGVTGAPSDDAVLRAVVQGDGGSPARVHKVTIGFSAVACLLANRVAAATAFWNVEGVTLRRRGLRTHEFRVDSYGAPRYPELVLVVRRDELRSEPSRLRAALAALADGTRAAIANPSDAVRVIAAASSTDAGLVRAELAAISPALEPPLRLDRQALTGWASFDARFGILSRPPDIGRTFDFSIAPK